MAAAVLSPGIPNVTKVVANTACYKVLVEIYSLGFRKKYPTDKGFGTLFFYFILHHGAEYGIRWYSDGINDAYSKWLVDAGWVAKFEPFVLNLDANHAIYHRRRNNNI